MRRFLRRLVLPAALFAMSVCMPAQGRQSEAPPAQTLPDADGEIAAHELPLDVLRLRLLPMTQEELVVEADAWRDAVQEKVRQISDIEIRIKTSQEAARQELMEQAAALREERTALIDRAREALDALTEKGGEVGTHEAYLKAVSGITLDTSDAGATWTAIVSWLQSKEGGIRWAVNIGLFVGTLLLAWIAGRVLGSVVGRSLRRFQTASELLRDFLINLIRKIVYLVGIVVALSMLEVKTGPFLAAIGAAGFVLGFALQDTLGNFASGVMILLYRPFDVGDFVNAGGVSGKIKAMSMVSTTITTPDNQVVVVPNNAIWGNVITNVTGSDTRRVDLLFGIGYEDDIEKARRVLEDVVADNRLVLKDPEPVIRLHELADSSVNFVVRPWTRTKDYWDVYWDLTRQVKARFDAEGISIPFPQRDVHVHQVTSG